METVRFEGRAELTVGGIRSVHITRDAGFDYPHKNGKPQFSMIFTESGEMRYSFYGVRPNLTVPINTLCVIPRGLPYISHYMQDGTTIQLLVFDIIGRTVPGFLATPCALNSPVFAEIFHQIQPANRTQSLFLTGKIYELLHYVKESRTEYAPELTMIQPALTEIRHSYFENRKVSEYAARCGMCESNFRKYFKRITGQSFIEYRNALRLAHAQDLLSSGECTVAEAAYLVGFNTMSNYYDAVSRQRAETK